MAIAGNIGVGKTTLTNKISQRFHLQPYFERVINNPYLNDFYKDMDRWSFNLQVYFLSQRFIDQKKISQSAEPCVQDRSIYEDAEIFAYILNKQGHMSDRDYQNYRDLFFVMTEYLRKPDLVLYLKASTWTLITRIRKRGRDFEKSITIEYLHELNGAYDRWIERFSRQTNVLTVNADIVDFEKYPEHIENVYERLIPYINQEGGDGRDK
ncbi:deoxynucleoside kinase [candidate division KSB1 bacterium]|nr:deoxynucleoside kinase [candidate division KSB1 bacterium]RQW07219.1 MAG: deoxynucleoside kinase [candidate division KSB1 bacterium]